MAHAILSPSGAHRWMRCAGSVPLELRCPDDSSEFADEGTAAHTLAAMVLRDPTSSCVDHLGWIIPVGDREFVVDDEMAAQVQKYVDYVRGLGGELMVEQSLSIEHVTGETGASGTSDAVVALVRELIVTDLKYGRGVRVDAEENEQLQLYALGALEEFGMLGDFETVRMVIHQPRLDHVSEWACRVDALQLFANRVKAAAERAGAALSYAKLNDGALHENYLAPGEDQCRFCKARATCPALAKHVLATVADDFVDVAKPVAPQLEGAHLREYDNATLGNLMGAVDLIESWCKAVRAKTETELLAGRPVAGYKLVEGRRGARAWGDPAQAEELLKTMRLRVEQMYDLKLISPTSAEKLAKAGEIGPRQWPKVVALITQPDGKPSVAPESDKRPALAITAVADEFTSTETEDGLV